MFLSRLCGVFWFFLSVKVGAGEALGRFKCPPNNVLVVYDHELPHELYLACLQANICNNRLTCASSDGPCPKSDSGGLSFLQHVTEDNEKKLRKGCCTYTKPEEYIRTSCLNIRVTDNGSSGNKHSPDFAKNSSNPADRFQKPKRSLNVAVSGGVHVYLHTLRKSPKQILIVNDLTRINDGYTVLACYLICKNDKSKQEPLNQQRAKLKTELF